MTKRVWWASRLIKDGYMDANERDIVNSVTRSYDLFLGIMPLAIQNSLTPKVLDVKKQAQTI